MAAQRRVDGEGEVDVALQVEVGVDVEEEFCGEVVEGGGVAGWVGGAGG